MLPFDDGSPEYNEHEIAWFSKDWDAVQKLADQYKESPENELFSILNTINVSKNQRYIETNDYSKFSIDTALSHHVECLQAVYMSNLLMSGLSNQSHFNYLLNAVPVGKRYTKYAKLNDNVKDTFFLKLLMKHYTINYYDAVMYRDTLLKKNMLDTVLKQCKGLVTDEFLKTVTRNVKDQKELKKLL